LAAAEASLRRSSSETRESAHHGATNRGWRGLRDLDELSEDSERQSFASPRGEAT